MATMIGEQVWAQSGDIREVISVSKLIRMNDGHHEIKQIIQTMIKYGDASILKPQGMEQNNKVMRI